ncbi:anti-CRISPR protein AcrIIA6 [Streptococcus thermophilus]|uniref:anti-CRISPR protein AcrIIA6 n=1 Tax=Streptococcus thermophilus TaxID=1308 RepID=UPI0022FF3BAC|nr:anti-CRISPR protein AcrIIA6 [Streptococcus thermophilus]MDA5537961.1 anti-CRISPR protein AcrIIA6 [Streptococcus thermophilus]MDA5552526.1 anti-CRISPR protein AcrIIA6 [Streptococcus thermophilus]WCL60736.1 anti-CRISPR protein AcrIIA6 [Streptococcus thermophilus]
MEINNDIKELILEYVGRYFKFENDFYRLPGIKFTDANWQKFKNGYTAIEKTGASRVNAMLDCLFEDFELAMIGKAQDEYYLDNSLKMNMPFYAYYDILKKQQLVKWLKTSREDIIGGTGRMYTASGNYIANAYLEVALESSSLGSDSYMIQMRFKNYSKSQEPIPSGRKNRLEWIENNLENIR